MNRELRMLKKLTICPCQKVVSRSQLKSHLSGSTHMRLLGLLNQGYPKCVCGLAYDVPTNVHLESSEHDDNMMLLHKMDFQNTALDYYGNMRDLRGSVITEANTVLNDRFGQFNLRIQNFALQRRQEREHQLQEVAADLTGSVEPCNICLMQPVDPVGCSNDACRGIFCRACAQQVINWHFPCPRRCQPGLFRMKQLVVVPADIS